MRIWELISMLSARDFVDVYKKVMQFLINKRRGGRASFVTDRKIYYIRLYPKIYI